MSSDGIHEIFGPYKMEPYSIEPLHVDGGFNTEVLRDALHHVIAAHKAGITPKPYKCTLRFTTDYHLWLKRGRIPQ